ncbi:ABC transporter ATP-binding protein (plasmid) [Haloferax sp. S1W]|uniref:ABC transporter ATP-binding protein n=1 Tax=Haloferax sp. S1W TaxID=3377110 RepID=UPI0037C95A9C
MTKRFGGLVANDNLSLTIDSGEIRGIIGPNGSGKSTFFNVITGFYEKDAGTVVFDGTDITHSKSHEIANRGLVRTFQITTPFEELTVEDNLLAVYSPGLRITNEKRERAASILEFLDIDHVVENKAKELSGGQQKLLELGRVLMLQPKCILLDEPTAGVNPALQDRILEYLKEMNADGTTLVIIEHDMRVIQDITKRVTVFDRGSVIAEGTFEDVSKEVAVQEAYLGTDAETGEFAI